MNRMFRLYNQNRKEFWTVILSIIFIFILIQLFNYLARMKNQQRREEVTKDEIRYENQSKSIISGGSVSEGKRATYGSLIEEFLENCIKGNVDEAYQALSTQCKEELYPNIESFQNLYWNRNFANKKTYTFQSWNSNNTDTYIVKLYDDVLSTGYSKQKGYIEDYYTIIKEDGIPKLNISSYIKQEEINQEKEEQGIKVTVEKVDIFKEFYRYKIKIKNNTEHDIVWHTENEMDSVYVMNRYDIKFEALLYENKKSDFLVKAGEEKEITIKFAITFREDMQIKNMNMMDIVADDSNHTEKIQIKIEW